MVINPKDIIDKKPIEMPEAMDMAIGALFEKIGKLEKRMNRFERELKGGKTNE